jgi:subtilisin family serine protease
VPDHPQVFVLDTGLAGPGFRPDALPETTVKPVTGADIDLPDSDGDGFLDSAAGHGTFIAGIIGQVAPGCSIEVHKVLSGFGEGHEWDIAKCIYGLLPKCTTRTIVNISFGAYVQEQAHVMEWAIGEIRETGAVIVASAGNDATCRPVYPAALPGVVGVGALGADSPAPFTNYGPWIDVCAPGVEVVSTFFSGFDGRVPVGPDGVERVDAYRGWAQWSGTSFAAPVVVGNLARMMLLGAPSAHAAVRRLVHAPSGMTIPNLGRIINSL